MRGPSMIQVIVTLAFTLAVNGTVLQSKRTSRSKVALQRRQDTTPHQLYFYYPQADTIFENDEDPETKLYGQISRTISDALAFWGEHPDLLCTTFNKHDGVNKEYSQSSFYCKDGLSIELFNKRPESVGFPQLHVRVYCTDLLEIAAENGYALRDHMALRAGPRREEKGRKWLTRSYWSEDESWGVDIVFYKAGCPSDKAYYTSLGPHFFTLEYIEVKDRITIREILSLPPPKSGDGTELAKKAGW